MTDPGVEPRRGRPDRRNPADGRQSPAERRAPQQQDDGRSATTAAQRRRTPAGAGAGIARRRSGPSKLGLDSGSGAARASARSRGGAAPPPLGRSAASRPMVSRPAAPVPGVAAIGAADSASGRAAEIPAPRRDSGCRRRDRSEFIGQARAGPANSGAAAWCADHAAAEDAPRGPARADDDRHRQTSCRSS